MTMTATPVLPLEGVWAHEPVSVQVKDGAEPSATLTVIVTETDAAWAMGGADTMNRSADATRSPAPRSPRFLRLNAGIEPEKRFSLWP